MTRSTPARLYQERSNRTISPLAGQVGDVALEVPLALLASVGAARATTRAARGLRVSVMRLMAPPLPAASRPSKITTTRRPRARMYSWSLTSSTWSRRAPS